MIRSLLIVPILSGKYPVMFPVTIAKHKGNQWKVQTEILNQLIRNA